MTTRPTSAVVLVVGLSFVVSGCGGASAPAARTHLRLDEGGTRLFVTRGESLERRTERFTVPETTSRLLLRADCRGGDKGSTMKIQISTSGDGDFGYGGGGYGCTRAAGAGGLVVLGGDEAHPFDPGRYTVEVTAPPGATWSAAVDTD